MGRSLDCEMVKLILKQASVKHYDKTFIYTMTSDDKGKTIYMYCVAREREKERERKVCLHKYLTKNLRTLFYGLFFYIM